MATHDNGIGRWFVRLVRWLGGGHTSATTAPSRLKHAHKREWALLESVHSAALASLLQQQVERAGIPVLRREWGGGSAMLGGVPVGVSLFVPDDRLDQARAMLDVDAKPDAAAEGGDHEG